MGSSGVICWNSAGIRAGSKSTPEKLAFLDSQFPNANFAILALVETHHKNEEDIPGELLQYKSSHHLIHSPTHAETHGGLILFINKSIDIINEREVIPGRLINITISREKDEEINLSVFYGPQWCTMTKQDAAKVISNFSNLHSIDHNNIIIGDFNFVECDLDKGKGMSSNDRVLHTIFEDFTVSNVIVDPFRYQYPRKRQYSFVAQQGKSRGDRIYVSEDKVNTITAMKYINTPFNTAHKLMTFAIATKVDIGPGYYKMNSSVVNEALYRREIDALFQEITGLQIANPID